MTTRLVLACLVLLAGCTGLSDEAEPISSEPPVAIWPPGTGSIWVSVTNEGGQLVTGLEGFLLPNGQLLTDDVPGHISASALAPGRYVLEVAADGYLDGELPLVVASDLITVGELRLSRGVKPTPIYPTLTVIEVLEESAGAVVVEAATRMEVGSEVAVTGFFVTREGGGGSPAWLCDGGLPSLPPQCGGQRLVLLDLDPAVVPGVELIDGVYFSYQLTVRGTLIGPEGQ